jgi:hypothetical protein
LELDFVHPNYWLCSSIFVDWVHFMGHIERSVL